MASYLANTATGCVNFIVVRDEPTCGKAWRKGLELSTAPYVHLGCDDLEIASPTWAGICCETVDQGQLPCPVVRRPDWSIESCGGDMATTHNLIPNLQLDRTPCDFTVSPFLSRAQAEAIGMVDAHYKSDVYVSHKGRALGYETVVRRDFVLVHHRSDVGRRGPAAEDDRAYAEGMA